MKKLLLILALVPIIAWAVGQNKIWRVPNGGSVPSWGPLNLQGGSNALSGLLPATSMNIDGTTLEDNLGQLRVKPGGITRTELSSTGEQISTSSGDFETASTSFVDVTNLSINFTSLTGRRVMIHIFPDSGGNPVVGNFYARDTSNVTNVQSRLRILRDGSFVVGEQQVSCEYSASTTDARAIYVPGNFTFSDTPGSGSHNYKVQIRLVIGDFAGLSDCVLLAYEMK